VINCSKKYSAPLRLFSTASSDLKLCNRHEVTTTRSRKHPIRVVRSEAAASGMRGTNLHGRRPANFDYRRPAVPGGAGPVRRSDQLGVVVTAAWWPVHAANQSRDARTITGGHRITAVVRPSFSSLPPTSTWRFCCLCDAIPIRLFLRTSQNPIIIPTRPRYCCCCSLYRAALRRFSSQVTFSDKSFFCF